jgi:hypothetical protein
MRMSCVIRRCRPSLLIKFGIVILAKLGNPISFHHCHY